MTSDATSSAGVIPEHAEDRPTICGHEATIRDAIAHRPPATSGAIGADFDRIAGGFAVALHMHQPMIPDRGDMQTATLISNLRHMLDDPAEGTSRKASKFIDCYRRMGRIVPQLVDAGHRPRIMLEYSGCLLWGLRQMGLDDVIEDLRRVTIDPRYHEHVEWLGMPWGHPVAPSTPARDFRRHVRAWQHHFAGMFGVEALQRVRGFSPAEMALPNHPDHAHAFVRILRDCGYDYVLVQQDTVERPDGSPADRPGLPHRLVARDSHGQTACITAIIKTGPSSTDRLGRLEHVHEARALNRLDLGGRSIPPLAFQIADGENGRIIMDEFPDKYMRVMRESSGSDHPPLNVSAYLACLRDRGLTEDAFDPIQPILQHRIWREFREGAGPDALAELIDRLERHDEAFHMEGGSWSAERSWVAGYEQVLDPMQTASMLFRDRADAGIVPPEDVRYRNALYHLLLSQTSCYRYWGGGVWTERGREICRRVMDILRHDFPMDAG